MLIPREKWPFGHGGAQTGQTAKKVLKVALCVLAAVALVVAVVLVVRMVQSLLPSFAQQTNTAPDWLDEAYTFRLLLVNPREFLRLLMVTAADTGVNLFVGFVNITADIRTVTFALCGFFLMLCAASPVQGEESPLVSKRGKLLFGTVIALTYAMVLVVSVLWTAVGAYYIDDTGPQARYYLPLYPLLLLLFQGVFYRKRNNDAALLFAFCVLNGVLQLSLFVGGVAA